MTIKNLKSNGDPLDDVASDSTMPTVVESGRSRVGMASQHLDVFQRHALTQEIRYGGNPKGMRG